MDVVLRRHGPTLEAFEIIRDIVSRPSVLAVLGYSAEQVDDMVRQFGLFAGSGGLQACQQDDKGLLRAADLLPTALDEAPFMVPLLFLLVSRHFPVSLWQNASPGLALVSGLRICAPSSPIWHRTWRLGFGGG